VILLFLSCLNSSSELSTVNSDKNILSEDQRPDAAIQAARAAPIKGARWNGDWQPSLWSKDPNNPIVASLSKQLLIPVQRWDGQIIHSKPGNVSLIFLSPNEIPMRGMHGEVVFVLDGDWQDKDIARLPWLGGAVVYPKALMSLFVSSNYKTEIDLIAGIAAWQIADHYSLEREFLQRSVPLGLQSILVQKTFDPQAKDPRERAAAAQGEKDNEMVVRLRTASRTDDQQVLKRLVTDNDPWVRGRALDRINDTSVLAKALSDESSVNRVIAAHRLAVLASQGDVEAVTYLIDAADSPDAYVRWKAAYGLSFGSTIDVLLKLLNDVDIDVSRQAAQSLQKIGDSSALQALLTAVDSDNSFIRRWSLEALGAIESPKVIPVLQKKYETSTTVLEQEAAAKALHKQGVFVKIPVYHPPRPPKDKNEIEQYVNSKDATVRKDTAKFLAGRNGMSEHLKHLANDEDSEVRKSAVEAMGWNGDISIYDHIEDTDLDVLITALDGIRRSSIGTGKGLIPLLRHPDAEVRLRATQALASLQSLSIQQKDALAQLCTNTDERIRMSALRIHPNLYNSNEPSAWVRYEVQQINTTAKWNTKGVMTNWLVSGDEDQRAWLNGIIQFEDDLLHQRFSWNDERDKPDSHRQLRPPLFRPYGHPDRG
jgi:HEAT repeat protein